MYIDRCIVFCYQQINAQRDFQKLTKASYISNVSHIVFELIKWFGFSSHSSILTPTILLDWNCPPVKQHDIHLYNSQSDSSAFGLHDCGYDFSIKYDNFANDLHFSNEIFRLCFLVCLLQETRNSNIVFCTEIILILFCFKWIFLQC